MGILPMNRNFAFPFPSPPLGKLKKKCKPSLQRRGNTGNAAGTETPGYRFGDRIQDRFMKTEQ